MNELTQRGIAALKTGDRDAARQWLGAAIHQDATDLQAWLWLSGAVDRDEEQIDCLRQVLRLDPGNPVAARGLAQILERKSPPGPQMTENLTPRPAVPADTEENLLDRVVLLPSGQPAVPEATRPQPAPQAESTQAANLTPTQAPNGRVIEPIYPRQPKPSFSTRRPVFRARPSLVPVMLFFWLTVFTLYGLLIALGQEIELVFPAIIALGSACAIIAIIMIIRQFSTRYELTTHNISLPFHGKQVETPISAILTVDTHQTGFQKLLGTGDILLDVAINGVLSALTIRNIPQVKQRAEQILYMVHDQR